MTELAAAPDPLEPFDYSMNMPLHGGNGRRLLHMPHFEEAHSHTHVHVLSGQYHHHHQQILHFLSVICVFSIIFVILVIAAYCIRIKQKILKKHN